MAKPEDVVTSAVTAATASPDVTCPLRPEVWAALTKNARNLQCSPALYLELLIEKGIRSNIVTEQDIFLRVSDQKFTDSMLHSARDHDFWQSWWESLSQQERESIAQSLQAEAKRNDRAGVIELWAPR